MNLVSGATGNVGREVVRSLAAAGAPVRALTRRPPQDGASPWPEGVDVAVGDLNDPRSLGSALAGARSLFLLSGYDDVPGLMKAGRDAGLERVVLLSSGAVTDADVDAVAEPGYDETNVVVAAVALTAAGREGRAHGETDESIVTATVEEVTGHPPGSFERWSVAHATEFG